MIEQWQELKETITEMRDNNGTGTQQEVCKFLANLMDVLEKQIQEHCEDAISRQYLLDNCVVDKVTMPYVPISKIQEAPPIISQLKTGHWIFDDECKEHGHCSHCGYGSVDLIDGKPHNYCPKCGEKLIIRPQNRNNKK